eukprot:1536201-Rhodomonas_salina.2
MAQGSRSMLQRSCLRDQGSPFQTQRRGVQKLWAQALVLGLWVFGFGEWYDHIVPVRAAILGPIVEPHGQSLRTTNSW